MQPARAHYVKMVLYRELDLFSDGGIPRVLPR